MERVRAAIRNSGCEFPMRKAGIEGVGALYAICRKPATERFGFLMRPTEGSVTHTYCLHNGLMTLPQTGNGWYTVTPDALTSRTVNILDAFLVLGSTIVPCCAPSVLCFQDVEDTERFAQAFDGKKNTLGEAITWMRLEMTRARERAATK